MSREFFFSRFLAVLVCCTLPLLYSFAQLQLDTAKGPEFLVREVLKGNGVLVGNVSYNGPKHAIAYFKDDSLSVGIREGVLLSTGNVFLLSGPNRSTFTSYVNGTGGDKNLESIARGKTYDAAILEFDFITASENLSFGFVFGSEEYLEYVDSKFNDVFGFFITGPGHDNTNIAILPNEKTPITVNTVNNKRNEKYYIDNAYVNTSDQYIWDARKRQVIVNKDFLKDPVPPPYNVEFDGFTTLLKAWCTVIPNEKYRIKIAIADVADPILDSGVFLEGNSFSSYGNEIVSLRDPFEVIIEEDVEPQESGAPIETAAEIVEKIPIEISLAVPVLKIEFEFDKHTITDASDEVLMTALSLLNRHKHKNLLISGHTDNIGSNEYNRWLSFMRSMAVFNWLNDRGIAGERMRITYYGETMPIESNSIDSGRARNRRVELQLIDKEK
jgi:outer membrane protein OmpA-like peptidoglycan-associated protein